jgi:broad specificity phosphatase PhoE
VSRSPGIERVWIVRHGQIEENTHEPSKRFSAAEYNRMIVESDDAPLTTEGRFQIEALIEQFRDRPLPAIHASPLLRAQQTAAILAEPAGLPVVTMDGFREMVASRVVTQVRPHRLRSLRYWFIRSMIRQFMPYSTICETAWNGRSRVRRAWQELLAWGPEGGSAATATERLVISHRGTAMLLRSVLRFNPEWEITRWSIANGGIIEIVHT